MDQRDYDPERAFRRAREIVHDIEAEMKPLTGGRELAMNCGGIWLLPRKILLAQLLVTLYDCPAYGLPLDNWIIDFLDNYLAAPLRGSYLHTLRRGGRPALDRRRSHGHVRGVANYEDEFAARAKYSDPTEHLEIV